MIISFIIGMILALCEFWLVLSSDIMIRYWQSDFSVNLLGVIFLIFVIIILIISCYAIPAYVYYHTKEGRFNKCFKKLSWNAKLENNIRIYSHIDDFGVLGERLVSEIFIDNVLVYRDGIFQRGINRKLKNKILKTMEDAVKEIEIKEKQDIKNINEKYK